MREFTGVRDLHLILRANSRTKCNTRFRRKGRSGTLTKSSAKKGFVVPYTQITPAERYTLGLLRREGFSNAAMARILGRHRSTIGREFARNCARHDGAYRPSKAQEKTNGRRSRSRRNRQFSEVEWQLVETLLRDKFSPEQISG